MRVQGKYMPFLKAHEVAERLIKAGILPADEMIGKIVITVDFNSVPEVMINYEMPADSRLWEVFDEETQEQASPPGHATSQLKHEGTSSALSLGENVRDQAIWRANTGTDGAEEVPSADTEQE